MLIRALKATERSLYSTVMRLLIRAGAVVAPTRTAEFVAGQFFKTTKAPPQSFSITAPVRGRIEVPDGTVVTYRWGDVQSDPTVVLVHGWNGWSQQMERFVAPLQARGFAVLALDHLAHGASRGDCSSLPQMARTLEYVFESLPQPAGVIAHSLGAAATAAMLASTAHQLRGAVLIAPPSDPRPYLARLARMIGAPRRMLPTIQRVAERIAGVQFDRLVAQPSQLQRIRTPLLIVHDVNDAEVPITSGYAYTAAPSVRMIATDGLGHRRILRDLHVVDSAAAFIARTKPERFRVRAPRAAEHAPYEARREALLPAG
jgi:pimeloyl-ACP methyl ester carboxylesterase